MNTHLRWKRWRVSLYLLCLVLSFLSGFTAYAQEGAGTAHLLVVRGAVTPIVQSYIDRAIENAELEGAEVLIIQLDTPGGSVDVTQKITQRMLAAQVPIVVYVAPAGAHAASAGTFITLAAHFAAMAPGTSIGAASPISGTGEELSETAQEKAIAILEADLKGLAKRRGEKAEEWAGLAVREAKAATAEEALELGVIDIIAESLDDLLNQLDGREVVVAGKTIALHTAGLTPTEIPMTPLEQFLHTITDPNIAFILMTLGLNGILFELASPGGYVAGIIGAICLLLALYALGVLSVNYTGLLFIVLAFVLFIVDIMTPTHGVLTAGGIASFIVGSLVLFSSSYMPISISLVIGVGVVTGLFFAFIVAKAVGALRRQPTTGTEGLVGEVAEVRVPLTPRGMVFVRGEWWNAQTEDNSTVEQGEPVEVVRREGATLVVRPLKSHEG